MKKIIFRFLIFTVLLFVYGHSRAQSSISGANVGTGHVAAGGEFLGWTNALIPLDFQTSGALQMRILQTGEVGINVPAPTYKLDVDGDINLQLTSVASSAFRIDGYRVLWHHGDQSSIYVGVGAGSASPASSTLYNTCVGNNAGLALTTNGYNNTAVGFEALKSLHSKHDITAVGFQALTSYNATGTLDNALTAVGSGAMYTITNGGFQNTAVGYSALHDANKSGSDDPVENTAIGNQALEHTTTGFSNTALGDDAGDGNYTGAYNLMLGSEADVAYPGLYNASAIGAHSFVKHKDEMVLGGIFSDSHVVPNVYHSTFVGVGLSGNSTAFGNALEINADYQDLRYAVNLDGYYPSAGIRFRQVKKSGSNNDFGQPFNQATINSWGKVLTVDENGDVGLTDDQSGTPTCNNATDISTGAVQWGKKPLLHDTEVPMTDGTTTNEWSVYFSGQSDLANSGNQMDLYVGHLAGYTDPTDGGKLDVECYSDYGSLVTGTYNNRIAGKFHESGKFDSDANGPPVFVAVEGKTDVGHTTLYDGSSNIGGDFYATNADYNYGVVGTADGNYGLINFGLSGSAKNTPVAIGAIINASGSTQTTGVAVGVTGVGGSLFDYGVTVKMTPQGSIQNLGVACSMASIPAGVPNVGVYSDVAAGYGVPSNNATAVYGAVPLSATAVGNIAIYGDLGVATGTPPCTSWPCTTSVTTPDMAGYFNGDLVSTNGIYSVSDENLKENIHDIPDAIEILNQLNPKWYSFKQEQNTSMTLPKGAHYGLISQEVEQVLPNIVKSCTHPARRDTLGQIIHEAINFKAINYQELIPLLLAGMKQQQQQIADLQTQLNSHHVSQPSQDNSGEQNNNGDNNQEQSHTNAIDVTLSSKTIVLDQNQPNPFAQQTTISYFIPEGTKNVKIIFTDNKGNVLKEVDVRETGKGQLNVYAQDLNSGIYTYTLVADGTTIDSKKMVCNK